MQDPDECKSMILRYRSPAYTNAEVRALLDLVEKYKIIILNKATSGKVCRVKERTWANIAKLFNKQGFEHHRNADQLKSKWENLKKIGRKLNKNILDGGGECDETMNKLVAMINCETNTNEIPELEELEDSNEGDLTIELEELQKNTEGYSDADGIPGDEDINLNAYKIKHPKSESYINASRSYRKRLVPRSKNFSPEECSLLLKCVRPEKKYVFNNETNPAIVVAKNRAWIRIANAFNRENPHRRSVHCLRTKFVNMKRLGKNLGFLSKQNVDRITDHTELPVKDYNVTVHDIKVEPTNETDNEEDLSHNGGHNHDSFDESNDGPNLYPDPLIGNTRRDHRIAKSEETRYPENSETSRLQLELLKCQLENAKLEKKRIEDAMRAEAYAVEMRETEMAIRLRAARLEAVAAALKFPPGHPALMYTIDEKRAEDYINNCQQ